MRKNRKFGVAIVPIIIAAVLTISIGGVSIVKNTIGKEMAQKAAKDLVAQSVEASLSTAIQEKMIEIKEQEISEECGELQIFDETAEVLTEDNEPNLDITSEPKAAADDLSVEEIEIADDIASKITDEVIIAIEANMTDEDKDAISKLILKYSSNSKIVGAGVEYALSRNDANLINLKAVLKENMDPDDLNVIKNIYLSYPIDIDEYISNYNLSDYLV